ncbi:MAG: pyruvate ferredoxin oxidoreductase [Chloroflexi bacterium]|nr:pyruvate ferredoxin oxidoreductase [Chloroflexota bacterium]
MRSAKALTGNIAVAQAIRQINPHVCAAYPITPTTQIMQEVAQFVADGLMETELVPCESEHSAMSACVGASAAGARVITATSANGLALMWEVLYIASGLRLPVVMAVGNRALSGPLNIHCDHSDSMGARDSGWIQIYAETAQEAYDNILQAVRIAEHPDVLLPVMTCMDGFLTTHTSENVELLGDAEARDFVGAYHARYSLLDVDNPITYGPNDLPDSYTEHKYQQVLAMQNAARVICEIDKEFGERFGRSYGMIDTYCMEDAETAIVVLSSTAGIVKEMVDTLRAEGRKVGLLRPRVFRPFPAQELVDALKGLRAVAVMDRALSFGAEGGPLFTEVQSALRNAECGAPKVVSRVFGLGGRAVARDEIREIYDELDSDRPVKFRLVGVRE